MFKKVSKLYSIFKGRCPKCNEGKFFKFSISYNPRKVTKIFDHCSNCNLKYMIEPSFYFGAMYINYGITVAISIFIFLISKLVFESTLLQSFAAIIFSLVILAPFNLRLSRIIWIHMFVNFDSKTS